MREKADREFLPDFAVVVGKDVSRVQFHLAAEAAGSHAWALRLVF
ncbi:hypothetical protein AB0D29_03845 [Streptomyces sp. NPDC048424]